MDKINKQFLENRVYEDALSQARLFHPGAKVTDETDGQLSPVEYINLAFARFFDPLSEDFKRMKVAALREITESCYKSEYLDALYPAQSKVEQCKNNVNMKHLGTYLRKKDQYYLNGVFLKSIQNF